MDCLTLLSNAISADVGAFFGALAVYVWACCQEKRRAISSYLSLLLFIYDQLDAVYKILKDIPPKLVKEVDGIKTVEFTMPLPKLSMTPQQFQRIMEFKFMLMSVRVQYEQQTNAAFPLE